MSNTPPHGAPRSSGPSTARIAGHQRPSLGGRPPVGSSGPRAGGSGAGGPSVNAPVADAAGTASAPAAQPANSNSLGKNVGRGSLLMASGTFVSRALGTVRNILLVAAVGATGPIANAFDIANKIPNMMYALLATGLINAILVPQIVRAMKSDRGQEYIDKLLTVTTSVLLVATILGTAGAYWIVHVFVFNANWTPAQVALAVAFAFWCVPQLFFYGLYAILGQVLNARRQFGPYMWAPSANNIISIIGFGLFIWKFGRAAIDGSPSDLSSWSSEQTIWIGAISTLGVAAQALILIVPLRRSGFRWRPRFGFRGIGLRSAGAMSLWIIGATLLDQLGVWWITQIATSAPVAAIDGGFTDGVNAIASNATYTQALMIYLLPHSLITVSVATALFTGMSESAALKDITNVRRLLSSGIRIIGVFTVIATVAFAVMSGPLVKALVPSMRPLEVLATEPVLRVMAFGLVPLGIMVMMKWVFFAFEDGKTVFLMQIPGTAVLILVAWVFSLIFPGQLWVVGIGIAMVVSNVVIVAARAKGLRRFLNGLDGARILRLHVQLVVAAAVATIPGILIMKATAYTPADSWGRAIWVCVLAGSAMLIVYLASLKLMHVRELTDLAAPLLRKLHGIRGRSAKK